MSKEEMLIGTSLGTCIREIVEGRVQPDQVEKICTGTAAANRSEFEAILDQYCQPNMDWGIIDTDKAKQLALELYDAGKIDQPRLRGEKVYGQNPENAWTTRAKLDQWLKTLSDE